ncbi:hypothetical protein ETB97_011137 [Aspergillus alliaceus]|uniref:Uncharacterized protein n=1 Tax=Petromyces alliaceus TaxID=209559 RepID=A0A5N6FM33_PETAA|nr:uncharacterized protein BDW43DRAFT_313379 [Aspergillus alliaceus]KAB8231046.1 hypothetical protein BDW43DRAFT_313379 [Aspergillus alliaceus]KAE8387649.1 hypothetical protein BDV23DRAFT_160806 [Aspergillus alliaceus]KAF5862789.1 hypothetical protein ETB97_011137 [Aspergillus burnettii]
MSLSKAETDIILNKANVALARSQRLVASWLPPKTLDEQTNKSEEELQREEDEIFTAVPETLGVGAPLPNKAADGSWNRTELGSNDKLRKQLLGKNYNKVMSEKNVAAGRQPGKDKISSGSGSAMSPSQIAGNAVYDDDEEEGRTSIVRRKSTKKRKADPSPKVLGPVEADIDGDGEGTALVKQPPSQLKGRKATSFLDEILAERSRKRKKR